MRDFRIVFNYELRQQLGKKSVRVTTIILMLVALIGTSMPRIIDLFQSNQPAQPKADTTLTLDVGYVFSSAEQQSELTKLLSLTEANQFASREALVGALEDKSLRVGFVLGADEGFEAIYFDKGVDDMQDQALSQALASNHREKQLAEKGLTVEEFTAIDSFQPREELTVLGKVTENNFLVSMVLMVMVYILVLTYGNTTSVMIAREKDTKAMELLITSTKPSSLIYGKVAAAGISGVVQFGAIILCAIGGFYLNQDFYDPMVRTMLAGTLSQAYVVSYIFFAVVGYLLYLFVYAALGSTVSRVEDVNSVTAIVQVILILGYMASSFMIGMPNGIIARITSLFPFTSIIVMPMRVGLTTVPFWEQALAAVLMIAFIAFFAWLSVKIYRWGTLNYGNKTSLIKVFREALRPERPRKPEKT